MIRVIISCGCICLLLSGFGPPEPGTGFYQGHMIEEGKGKTDVVVHTFVPDAGKVVLSVEPLHSPTFNIQFLSGSGSQHFLRVDRWFEKPVELMKRKLTQGIGLKKYCFENKGQRQVELCFSHRQINLKINEGEHVLLELVGTLFSKKGTEGVFQKEEETLPRDVSLESLIDVAFNRNFDCKINFERVFQAEKRAQATWLLLIPHLSSNLIWNASPSYITLIATVQAVAPFLLPSYWLHGREADLEKMVAEEKWLMDQANLAAMIEQISYGFERDRKLIEAHDEIIHLIDRSSETGLLKIPVWGFERVEEFLKSLEELNSLINSSKLTLEKVMQDEKVALSTALDLEDDNWIEHIQLEEGRRPVIDEADFLRPEEIEYRVEKAGIRSFEADQYVYLQEQARLKRVELLLSFLDPTSDPQEGFGINTVPQYQARSSQVRVQELEEKELRKIAKKSSRRALEEYNNILREYHKSKAMEENLPVVLALAKALQETLEADKTFDLPYWKEQIQRFLARQIENASFEYAYQVVSSKIDRLLLEGYYDRIMGHFMKA